MSSVPPHRRRDGIITWCTPNTIQPIQDCYRVGDQASDEWAPQLATQTWAEVERSVKEADREARRKKRTREDDMLGQVRWRWR